MPQATLINPQTGQKVVVQSGSEEAQRYFGQGFQLMGADGKPLAAPSAPQVTGGPARIAPTPAPIVQGGPAAIAPVQGPLAPAATPSQPAAPAKEATLYGPAGERVVVPVGSARAQELQARGFTLTADEAKGKKKATLVGPNGERRVVFVGTAEADELLKNKGYVLQQGPGSPVTTSRPARDEEFRSGQEQAQREADNAAEVRRLRIEKELADLRASLGGGQQAPTAPDLRQTYEDLRSQHGIADIETDLNALDQQIRDLEAAHRQGQHDVSNRLAPMETIRGEQRELAFQAQERLDLLNRQRQTKVDQLNTKVSMINQFMELTQVDFQNAQSVYESEFKRNYDMINFLEDRLRYEDEKARDERDFRYTVERDARTDARANLTTFMNLMQDSKRGWGDLNASTQAQITKLEATAGIPQGTVRDLVVAGIADKLLTTVEGFDSGGNGIVSFIYQGKDGLPNVVHTVKTGTRRQGSGLSQGQRDERAFNESVAAEVNAVMTGKYGTAFSRERAFNTLAAQYPSRKEEIRRLIYQELLPDGYESLIFDETTDDFDNI